MGHKVSNSELNLWACCKPSLYLIFVINSAQGDETSVHRWSLIWETKSVEEL